MAGESSFRAAMGQKPDRGSGGVEGETNRLASADNSVKKFGPEVGKRQASTLRVRSFAMC